MQTVTTIGLDIAKSVFQVHGVDAAGPSQSCLGCITITFGYDFRKAAIPSGALDRYHGPTLGVSQPGEVCADRVGHVIRREMGAPSSAYRNGRAAGQ
jgi:hypothetical protein